MATASSLIPLEEYMSMAYSPDCEYVDGAVLERNVGKGKHSYTQSEAAALLRGALKSRGPITLVEQRVRVSEVRVRNPEICVVSELEEVVTHAPLLCVEVFSPEDRWPCMNQSIADYMGMGVPCVWVIHPYENRAWIIDREQPPGEVRDGEPQRSASSFHSLKSFRRIRLEPRRKRQAAERVLHQNAKSKRS